MKVLSIAALLVAFVVLVMAMPQPPPPPGTQALLQAMGSEESYKLALIQAESELLAMKQDESRFEGGLIWGNKNGDHAPSLKDSEIQETDELSMQDILEMIGKLQEEQANEQDSGLMAEQYPLEAKDKKYPYEEIKAQETDKMFIQDMIEMIGKLQKEDQTKEEDYWKVLAQGPSMKSVEAIEQAPTVYKEAVEQDQDQANEEEYWKALAQGMSMKTSEAVEQASTKEAREELVEKQTPNKTDLQSILEMLSQLETQEKAEKQDPGLPAKNHQDNAMTMDDLLATLNQAQEQDDDEENKVDAEQKIWQSLSEKLGELQATMQSINELVKQQRRHGK